jgi:hypothetical protein
VWTKNNYVTNKFLKNNLRWDSSVSDTDKATFTQSLREIGQSPRGQVMLSGFMQAGKTLNIHSWSVANAQGELGGNGIWLNPDANQYNDPNSSSAWARTFNQATVMIHEMGHNLGYPDWAETQPRWALNTAYNENPYRAWIGSPRRTEYSTGIPSPRLFPDTAVWDSWDQ